MNILAWALVFPLGILFSGIMSCQRRYWLGIIPTIVFSIAFLSMHWIQNDVVMYFGDVCYILALTSVLVFGCCRLALFLVSHRKKSTKNSEIDKTKVQDL